MDIDDINILSKKKLKEEVLNYKNVFYKKKIIERVYLIFTIILLSLTFVSLIMIYLHPDTYGFFNHKNAATSTMDWFFITFIIIILFIVLFFCPIISFWYANMHKKIQIHVPIILATKVIDVCAIIVGVFNFITAILAALAPIILGWKHSDEWAWNADTKVVIYVIVCSIIFLFWSIIIPILQDKVNSYNNEYFERYIFFEFDKINIYINYLKKIYPKRVKEFNAALKNKKISKREQGNIINRPVSLDTPFSWDVRRVFKGKTSRYGSEYDIIKYILFIEIFSIIYHNKFKKHQLKEVISKYIRGKRSENVSEFNKNFNKYIKTKL